MNLAGALINYQNGGYGSIAPNEWGDFECLPTHDLVAGVYLFNFNLQYRRIGPNLVNHSQVLLEDSFGNRTLVYDYEANYSFDTSTQIGLLTFQAEIPTTETYHFVLRELNPAATTQYIEMNICPPTGTVVCISDFGGDTGQQGIQGPAGADGLGLCGIGMALPWFKNLYSTLPANFVECNGQTLSDGESPLNGMTIPNLNAGYFVRGSATAGTVQADQMQGHDHLIAQSGVAGSRRGFTVVAGGFAFADAGLSASQRTVYDPVDDGTNGTPRVGSETRPKNISAVWVMRVK